MVDLANVSQYLAASFPTDNWNDLLFSVELIRVMSCLTDLQLNMNTDTVCHSAF